MGEPFEIELPYEVEAQRLLRALDFAAGKTTHMDEPLEWETNTTPKSYQRTEGEDRNYTDPELRKKFTVRRKAPLLSRLMFIPLTGDTVRFDPIETDESYETLEGEYHNSEYDLDFYTFVDNLYDYLEGQKLADEAHTGARTGS